MVCAECDHSNHVTTRATFLKATVPYRESGIVSRQGVSQRWRRGSLAMAFGAGAAAPCMLTS
jgi:hypothetical protein